MLRFVFTDTAGKEHRFSDPLSLTLRMDEDVPADDCYAVFAYREVGELTNIKIYYDNRLVFVGVVDEQEHYVSEKGRFLKISARSLAAHLLDNEAAPQCYDHPSASLIYERHVRPYGIAWSGGDDATYYGEQQVCKGMSQWAALKNFCNLCFSASPRVTADGVLMMKGFLKSDAVLFSDEGGGIAYTQLSETIKRCEELSRVNIKVAEDGGYRYQMDNTDAISRGIRRERYLNAVLSATPMTCADAMLHNGAAAAYGITLKCPGFHADKAGFGAVVKNRTIGIVDDLYISGVSYRLDQNGGISTLRLKRRNNRCGYQDM